MELVGIYQCLCDRTRLRILNLLLQGELCVCHFQTVLREPQVKISKHLAYLRARRLVVTRRSGQRIFYSLPTRMTTALQANLACLQDCVREQRVFSGDLRRLGRLGISGAVGCDLAAPSVRR